MKKILIAIAVIGVFLYFRHFNSNLTEQAEVANNKAGQLILNKTIEVSQTDATLLNGISGKLESSCSRNKYGLSEDACVLAIRTRNNICTQQTVNKFPGQLSNTDRLQAVASSYVECIFQKT